MKNFWGLFYAYHKVGLSYVNLFAVYDVNSILGFFYFVPHKVVDSVCFGSFGGLSIILCK